MFADVDIEPMGIRILVLDYLSFSKTLHVTLDANLFQPQLGESEVCFLINAPRNKNIEDLPAQLIFFLDSKPCQRPAAEHVFQIVHEPVDWGRDFKS